MPAVVDSNFAPGGDIGRTRRNFLVIFDSGPFAPLGENITSSQTWQYMTIALSLDGDQATSTCSVHRTFREDWTCEL